MYHISTVTSSLIEINLSPYAENMDFIVYNMNGKVLAVICHRDIFIEFVFGEIIPLSTKQLKLLARNINKECLSDFINDRFNDMLLISVERNGIVAQPSIRQCITSVMEMAQHGIMYIPEEDYKLFKTDFKCLPTETTSIHSSQLIREDEDFNLNDFIDQYGERALVRLFMYAGDIWFSNSVFFPVCIDAMCNYSIMHNNIPTELLPYVALTRTLLIEIK